MIVCFKDPGPPEIYTLSLHDALPISTPVAAAKVELVGRPVKPLQAGAEVRQPQAGPGPPRSEEHTSELQSRRDLVCRLLLEKKKRGGGPPWTSRDSVAQPASTGVTME